MTYGHFVCYRLEIMDADDDSTGYSRSGCPRTADSQCSTNSDQVDMSFMMIDYLKDAMKVLV